MLNKQMLLFNSNTKEDYTPFYIDFGVSGGSFEISPNVIPTFYISYDGIEWTDRIGATDVIQAPSGRVYFKAATPTAALYARTSTNNAWDISGTNVKLGGNINSLLSSDNPSSVEINAFAFANMFMDADSIIDASELILPAKEVHNKAYYSMFKYCNSLTTSPIICAERILGSGCQHMFYNCTNLTRITCLATQIQDMGCYWWTYNVSSSGTFYKHRDSTWSTDVNGIPYGWDIKDFN